MGKYFANFRNRQTGVVASLHSTMGLNNEFSEFIDEKQRERVLRGIFDLYYQDVQQRIKDQQFPNRDLPRKGREKIDITIVVDMLLTGFDAPSSNENSEMIMFQSPNCAS